MAAWSAVNRDDQAPPADDSRDAEVTPRIARVGRYWLCEKATGRDERSLKLPYPQAPVIGRDAGQRPSDDGTEQEADRVRIGVRHKRRHHKTDANAADDGEQQEHHHPREPIASRSPDYRK